MEDRFTDDDFTYASFGLVLSRADHKRLPILTRLEILGVNFNLVENRTDNSLFDALTQALTGSQTHANVDEIHAEILDYVTNEQWDLYQGAVADALEVERQAEYEQAKLPPAVAMTRTEKKIHSQTEDQVKSTKSWTPAELEDPKDTYRALSDSDQHRGFMFELCAAAEKFKFTFGVIVFEPFKNAYARAVAEDLKKEFAIVELEDFVVHVYNCENAEIVEQAYVKYYFLQSSSSAGVEEWHYLQPKGSFYEIPNGLYEADFKRVISFHRNMHFHHEALLREKFPDSEPEPVPSHLIRYVSRLSKSGSRHRSRIRKTRTRDNIFIPTVLDHNGREFYYREYPYDDYTLFSILNHCLFDYHTDRRLETRLIIAMKRQEIAHFVEPVSERNLTMKPRNNGRNLHLHFVRSFNVGDVHDLDIAASLFAFSYELFILDGNMNWYYEKKKCPQDARSEVRGSRPNVHLILFARANEHKHHMKWYRLEESPAGFWNSERQQSESDSESMTSVTATTSTAGTDSDSISSFVEHTTTATDTETDHSTTPTPTSTRTPTPTPHGDTDESGSSGHEFGSGSEEAQGEEMGSERETPTSTADGDADAEGSSASRISIFSIQSTSSGSTSTLSEGRPRRSVFKSIPILLPELQVRGGSKLNPKAVHLILDYFKRLFHYHSDAQTTKVFLVPKVYSRDKKIHEIEPEMSKLLNGNVPWFASIPDSDHYMVTVNKNRPSTLFPLLAFHTAEANEMERRVWELTSSESDGEAEAGMKIVADSKQPKNKEVPKFNSTDDLEDLQDIESRLDSEFGPTRGERAPPPGVSYFYRMLHRTVSAITRLSNTVGARVRTLFVRNPQVHPLIKSE